MLFQVQNTLRKSVRLLLNKGVYIGLTNQTFYGLMEKTPGISFLNAMNSYSELFPVLEWKTDFQHLIDEALLSGIIASRLKLLAIRFDCSEQLFTRSVISQNPVWQNFVSLLFENKFALDLKLVFCFERSTLYSSTFLDQLLEVKDKLHSFNPSFEFEHRSWKNPNALKVFRAAKISIIQRDAPLLLGFYFTIPNYSQKENYIRFLGRNQVNWFSKEAALRYSYDYTKAELQTLLKGVEGLHPNYDRTVIIAAHQPPETALSNLLEFASIYSHD